MAERFDLDAIAADDALLDLFAAGDASAIRGLGEVEDDPAIHLLAELRLAVEVDESSFEMVDDAESFLAACAARNPDPLARKIATRSIAAGIAAVAALSVSGVAAAVTGDPLSPYERVFEAVVEELSPRSSVPLRSLDGVVGSKAKGIKASKDIKERAGRQQTGDGTVKPASNKDLLANRLKTPLQIPPQVPPQTEDKPPLKQQPTEVQPTEVQPPEPVETDEANPPETQPSKPVEPAKPPETTQPTQPPPTPTPTPTPPATTTAPPPSEETTGTGGTGSNGQQGTQGGDQGTQAPQGNDNGNQGNNGQQGTQGNDNDPHGNANTPEPQPTVVPTQPPPENSPSVGPGDAGQDDEGKDEQQTPQDPFAAALIRNILAMLNGVMVAPR